jgi:hypothetical protein
MVDFLSTFTNYSRTYIDKGIPEVSEELLNMNLRTSVLSKAQHILIQFSEESPQVELYLHHLYFL